MQILAICTTTNAISFAVINNNKILGEFFINTQSKISEKIIYLLDNFLKTIEVPLKTIEGIAVTLGPGPFTNLRVGIIAAKTLAQTLQLPIAGIDSLEAVARNVPANGTVAVVLKACRDEVNAALFGGVGTQRLSENLTLTIDQLAKKLASNKGPIYLAGDGAGPVIDKAGNNNLHLAPAVCHEPRAAIVAFMGLERLKAGQKDNLFKMHPAYSHAPNIKKTEYGKNTRI